MSNIAVQDPPKMTREEHVRKLKELLAVNENETYHLQCASNSGRLYIMGLLRREKEFLEHEILKLTWDEQPVPTPPVASINKDGGDDSDGNKKEPVLV